MHAYAPISVGKCELGELLRVHGQPRIALRHLRGDGLQVLRVRCMHEQSHEASECTAGTWIAQMHVMSSEPVGTAMQRGAMVLTFIAETCANLL
jgi:hypothetical protein